MLCQLCNIYIVCIATDLGLVLAILYLYRQRIIRIPDLEISGYGLKLSEEEPPGPGTTTFVHNNVQHVIKGEAGGEILHAGKLLLWEVLSWWMLRLCRNAGWSAT